jgi:hypothetical protein
MKPNKIMLTQSDLKELLTFNPNTGIFNWIKRNRNVAGHRNCKGYVLIRIKGKRYRAHRLAWFYVNGDDPENLIDHINHITDDNRIINLRKATLSQNVRNQRISAKNTSGLKGVCWNKKSKKWQSQIKVLGKLKYLGVFTDKNEAHQAYCKAADDYHKEFANHG